VGRDVGGSKGMHVQLLAWISGRRKEGKKANKTKQGGTRCKIKQEQVNRERSERKWMAETEVK